MPSTDMSDETKLFAVKMKDMHTGRWVDPARHKQRATDHRRSPRETLNTTPRGVVIGTSPRREMTLQVDKTKVPHVYCNDVFPRDKLTSGPRNRRDPVVYSAVFPPKVALPKLQQEDIPPTDVDLFEAQLEQRTSESDQQSSMVHSAQDKIRSGSGAAEMSLAALRLASYSRGGTPRRSGNTAPSDATPPLIGLLAGVSLNTLIARYRWFCENQLVKYTDRQPPLMESSDAAPPPPPPPTESQAEQDMEVTAARSWLQHHTTTYNGPILDVILQRALLNAIAGLPSDSSLLSLDFVRDATLTTALTSTAATVALYQGKEDASHLKQTSAPHSNFRFAHLFCVAADHLGSPIAHRNVAFILMCFDPTSCGKVPQHLFVETSFLQKFIDRHVWKGVQGGWQRLALALNTLNKKRANEDTLLAQYLRAPVGAAVRDDGVPMFSWAIETFVGSHDYHRDRNIRDGVISRQLFGVPWDEARTILLGIHELYSVLSVVDLRYDRDDAGPGPL